MAEKYVLAEKDYVKGMKYKDIAEKYEVSINTVKSWKKRYGWNRERGAPKEKGVHTKKKGAPKGNINAKGNRGGAAPKGNQNATTHGLFAKYLPKETLDIVNEIDNITPLDILWMNIKMQFASIMRAQQIMFVEDKWDMTKEVKKTESSSGDSFDTEKNEWEIQFAWDKQANFLNSQSRAMGELRSMLKQFNEMASEDDIRLLEIKRMQASIEKTKKETEFIIERTKLIQGEKKDTSLLETLIDTVTSDD
ncbi:hypothetical protein GCM10011391_28130 [Pullulanibacillus camelliae]|uniref:Terminase ATPase subunit N-terminal domain-containing protein n=1 Tax=Pullulanibacillus camelliae TaxID=1707096 RepID=A0A8J2YJX6_9BACL|nr:phage terminase small subunit [Pullulanibacillus camelliae]GGE47731.1 hypothetical protein GCM10011391_28130 [Pullulanibacillus camelliae]